MTYRIALFEDEKVPRLHPLTLTRPAWDLRVGILTLGEKWAHEFGGDRGGAVHGDVREDLEGVFDGRLRDDSMDGTAPAIPDSPHAQPPMLRINARYLPSPLLNETIRGWLRDPAMRLVVRQDEETVVEGIPAGAKGGQAVEHAVEHAVSLTDLPCVERTWDLLRLNCTEIEADIERRRRRGSDADGQGALTPGRKAGFSPGAFIDDESRLFMDESALVEPGTVIITTDGPVHIGRGAKVLAGSLLRGPVTIGDHAVLKMGAKIYKDTTIGPWCKIGGEVNHCIFHSCSNKGHDGYTGTSIFGQWINLGAGTNTSNLKSNYGPVRVYDWSTGDMIDSGQQFQGTVMGDHGRTSIGTTLNTGTVAGVCTMIFGAGFPAKMIPSFSWVDAHRGEISTYGLDKALLDMERMMSRREGGMDDAYRRMMTRIFESRTR